MSLVHCMVIVGVMVILTQPGVITAGEDCVGLMVLQSGLGLDSIDSMLCGSKQLSERTALLLATTWQTILVWLQHNCCKQSKPAPACFDRPTFCGPSQLVSIHYT